MKKSNVLKNKTKPSAGGFPAQRNKDEQIKKLPYNYEQQFNRRRNKESKIYINKLKWGNISI